MNLSRKLLLFTNNFPLFVSIVKSNPNTKLFLAARLYNTTKETNCFRQNEPNHILSKMIYTAKLTITRTFTKSIKNRFSENLAALQIKKRPLRKKRIGEPDTDGYFNVTAYATADEYDLERLRSNLFAQNLYKQNKLIVSEDSEDEHPDILYVTAKYQLSEEPREIFFFREGSVVLWNCSELECSNILTQLQQFEHDSYDKDLVHDECEQMAYNFHNNKAELRNSNFYLTKNVNNSLEKYTFSNSLSTSVKLGIWEALLDQYVESMAYITEDLKRGTKIKMSRSAVLRKTGELFALRHLINLSSDLLDTPDFYWDREQLEALYSYTCSYFSIQRRTKVMNEKLNHCVELAELVSSNLNDAHHVRLEWMIIVLIMVEVAFEALHYAERYLAPPHSSHQEVLDEK